MTEVVGVMREEMFDPLDRVKIGVTSYLWVDSAPLGFCKDDHDQDFAIQDRIPS